MAYLITVQGDLWRDQGYDAVARQRGSRCRTRLGVGPRRTKHRRQSGLRAELWHCCNSCPGRCSRIIVRPRLPLSAPPICGSPATSVVWQGITKAWCCTVPAPLIHIELPPICSSAFKAFGCDRSTPATSFVVAALLLAACLPPVCCETRGARGSVWPRQSEVTQQANLRRRVQHLHAHSSVPSPEDVILAAYLT